MAEKMRFMMLRDYLLADKLSPIFTEILKERINQVDKFGEQNHPMKREIFDSITHCNDRYPSDFTLTNTVLRSRKAIKDGGHCWFDILLEEICEVFLEKEPKKQREEMIQVAAVAVAIIEYLDKQGGNGN